MTCRHCYWWKRRGGDAGTCWRHHAMTAHDESCELFEARTVSVLTRESKESIKTEPGPRKGTGLEAPGDGKSPGRECLE